MFFINYIETLQGKMIRDGNGTCCAEPAFSMSAMPYMLLHLKQECVI